MSVKDGADERCNDSTHKSAHGLRPTDAGLRPPELIGHRHEKHQQCGNCRALAESLTQPTTTQP
jgi:hypothetical protein